MLSKPAPVHTILVLSASLEEQPEGEVSEQVDQDPKAATDPGLAHSQG